MKKDFIEQLEQVKSAYYSSFNCRFSPTQIRILTFLLNSKEKVTQKSISESLSINLSQVNRSVKELALIGTVYIVQDQRDKRQSFVYINYDNKDLIKFIDQKVDIVRKMFRDMNQQELYLSVDLDKILTNLK